MTKDDINFPHDDSYLFLKGCVFNPAIYDAEELKTYNAFLDDTLAKAFTTEQFINLYLANTSYKHLQGYQELLQKERPERTWYFVRENFGEKCFKTDSDISGVKVGNDEFSININNGYGDGTTRVAVFDDEQDFCCDHIMHYQTSIKGHCFIYDYDCGGKPVKELNGKYFVYDYRGLVAFVKFKNRKDV